MTQLRATKPRINPHWLALLGIVFFFGWTGVHRIITGKIATGVLMFLTFGGLVVFWIIDFVVILSGRYKDANGSGFPMFVYAQSK